MRIQQHQTLALLFAAVMAMSATGCGVQVDPALTAADCRQEGDLLAGQWVGTWQSFDRGSIRSVQADFTACGGGEYRARYVVPFGGVIPCMHELTHSAGRQGNELRFCGTMTSDSLLKAGTRFAASSDGVTLVINYQSGIDFGVMRLRRADSAPERVGTYALVDAIGNLGR